VRLNFRGWDNDLDPERAREREEDRLSHANEEKALRLGFTLEEWRRFCDGDCDEEEQARLSKLWKG
jgi:hypothetical protein